MIWLKHFWLCGIEFQSLANMASELRSFFLSYSYGNLARTELMTLLVSILKLSNGNVLMLLYRNSYSVNGQSQLPRMLLLLLRCCSLYGNFAQQIQTVFMYQQTKCLKGSWCSQSILVYGPPSALCFLLSQ